MDMQKKSHPYQQSTKDKRITFKCVMLKKEPLTDNNEQSFAPLNFKFKFNFTDFKERADN